ncbi:MAG: capsular polysaccharide synthesis protein [Pseudomonadota bacterium]
MNATRKVIPRTIWLLWYQGISDAPFIVKECVDSWVRKNPTWDVIILDSTNLNAYVDLDMPAEILENIPLTQQSDIVRLKLLSNYGGIWADATTLCLMPLDNWIDKYTCSGFFTFHKPGADRLLSSWFIASEKNCALCDKLYKELRLYWINNKFGMLSTRKKKLVKKLSKYLNKNEKTARWWFNPLITKVLKVYPYFAIHYMFERLISKDKNCKQIWEEMKILSADIPHLVLQRGIFSKDISGYENEVVNLEIPMLKLTWKYDDSKYSTDSLLHHVITKNSNSS